MSPLGSDYKKLAISKINIGSLNIELIPWDQVYILLPILTIPLSFMENTNTIISFTDYFIRTISAIRTKVQLPFPMTKDDLNEIKKIINANDNPSNNKCFTLNIYKGCNVTNNITHHYSSSDIREISNEIDQLESTQKGSFENNNSTDYEYGDSIEIAGFIVSFNWDTNKGQIRTKLFGAQRAKKYDYYFLNPHEIPEQFTKYTNINAKAIPVYKSGGDKILFLELSDVKLLT